MILEAFEYPIVKRDQLQSYLILSSKGFFKNQNVFLKIEMYFLQYRDDSNSSKKLN